MDDDFHKLFHWSLNVLIVLNLAVLLVSFFYVVRLFRKNLKEYWYYRYVAIIDTRVLFKILFNYKTELYKYLLLGSLLLFEFSFTTSSLLVTIIGTIKHANWLKGFNETTFNNCTKGVFEIHYEYYLLHTYPYLTTIITIIFLIIISFFQLFSFLCTYLKRRYNGYNIDKRVVSKYAAWWCIQAVLLFLCTIPYTQILLAVIGPLLLFINWIVLVLESRSLSRAIQSVLYEIKHFECDDVRYKTSYASYKTYKVFIRFQLTALFFFVLSSLAASCITIIKYLVFYNCNSYRIVNTNINISEKILKDLYYISSIFSNYLIFIAIILYLSCAMVPLILRAFTFVSRYTSKKIKLLKYDRNLSQPFI